MADSRPKLVSVESSQYEPLIASATDSQSLERRFRIGLWLMAALLVAALAAAWVQSREIDALTAQVEGLGVELETAQQALSAYESHLGEIRTSVDGLRAQFGVLDDLVSQDPATTPSD